MSVLGFQSDADMDEDFSFLQPLDLITKDPYELHNIVKAKKENLRQHKSESDKITNELSQDNAQEHVQEAEKDKIERENEQGVEKMKLEKEREQEKGEHKEVQHPDQNHTENHEDKIIVENLENKARGGKYKCLFSLFPLHINHDG